MTRRYGLEQAAEAYDALNRGEIVSRAIVVMEGEGASAVLTQADQRLGHRDGALPARRRHPRRSSRPRGRRAPCPRPAVAPNRRLAPREDVQRRRSARAPSSARRAD